MNGKAFAVLLCGCATWATAVHAQEQSQTTTAVPDNGTDQQKPELAQAETDAIVVTGSRITQHGYAMPTPVTVLTAQLLEQSAPSNLPDALNKTPQFQNSLGQATSLTNADRPYSGNYLDLRGVGPVRALVLLDGRRVPPTSYEGTVDTNLLPQLLVQRIDVVTAGASAVYGSDAVSGVVNFVLDTKFNGVKGVAQRSVSQRGDNGGYRTGIAAGTGFANDRGHVEFSVERFVSDGIPSKKDRPGQSSDYLFLGSGTAADPYKIYPNTNFSFVSRGGLAVSGPFAGQQFLPGGVLAPFNPGTIIGNRGLATGGEDSASSSNGNTVLSASLKTLQSFGRLSYEIVDGVEAYVQGGYAESRNHYNALEDNFRVFIPIYSGNPYLSDAAQAQLTATNTPSFTINRADDRVSNLDTYVDTVNRAYNLTAGFKGDISPRLHFEAYYTHGDTKLKTRRNESENTRFFAAIDAVDQGEFQNNVANGNIVCRVTLTNPGLYPGCTPLNLLGEGSSSPEALAWQQGITRFAVRNKLDEWNVNVGGDVVDLWAGPLAINIGADYRKQSLEQTSNADPSIPLDITGLRGISPNAARFVYTNVGVANGSYNVKEVYGEFALPLLRDAAFAKSLDLNGAIRYTDYSTSGSVVTWKAGLTYAPIPSIRFRGTVSRDIRAPTLYDFFAGRSFNSTVLNDRLTGVSGVATTFGGGNLQLKPEIAKTYTAGVVLQPDFLPGFSLSADYYDLTIRNAITSLDAGTIADTCFASGGTDPVCSRIVRPFPTSNTTTANFPTSVDVSPINGASLHTRGIDVDASYDFNLDMGATPVSVRLQGLANYDLKFISATGASQAGRTFDTTSAFPRMRLTMNATLSTEHADLFIQGRYFTRTKLSDLALAGSGYGVFDPVHAPAAFYMDMTLTGHIDGLGGSISPFISVNNLLDKKPPLIPAVANPGVTYPTILALYDVVGRAVTAGVRFKF